jgi:hypothetical protein
LASYLRGFGRNATLPPRRFFEKGEIESFHEFREEEKNRWERHRLFWEDFSMARVSLQKKIDGFIGWMEKEGMLARWEEKRGLKKVVSNQRKLKEKIRVEKAAREILIEIRRK